MIGRVLLLRRVTQPDFLLVVELRLIVGTRAGVDHPLHESGLDRGLVPIIGLAVRFLKPMGEVLIGSNPGAPCVHDVFRLIGENLAG